MVTAASIEAGGAFVKIWADDAQAQAALSKLQGRMRHFADEVAAIGKGMALFGTAMTIPVAKAVKQYAAFADKMSAVGAIVQANEVQFARLNRTAKDMAKSFTPTEIAEGMLELGRAGFNTREIIESIPGSLDLARAGAMHLGEATDILANTLRSFGMDTDLTDQVADILAMTANISTTDIHGIGDAMKHVASSAKLSGQSLERVSAALAVMANRGLKGELAGTALARTLVKLAETETRELLQVEFGVDTTDAQGNLRDVLDIFRDLGKATAGFGNAEKLELFKELFDMRGMKGAINLAEHIGEWEKITQALQKSEGEAKRVAAAMDDNVGGSFRDIAAKAELLQIALGEALSSPLREWGKTLVSVMQSTGAFIDRNQEFITGLVKMGVIFTVAGTALFVFGKGAKGLVGVIGIFKRLSDGLKDFHGRATGVTTAQKAMADAKEALEKAGKNQAALLEREAKAAEKLTAAQERAAKADARLTERKRELIEAQKTYDAALNKAVMQRQKVAAAEVSADESRQRADAQRLGAGAAPQPLEEQAKTASRDNAKAREDYEAATRALTAAERELAGARTAGAEAKSRSERADAAAKAAQQEEQYRKERLIQAETAHTEAAQREAVKRQRIAELEAQAKAAAQKATDSRATHAGFQAQLALNPGNADLQRLERSAGKDVARQDELAASLRNRLALETAQLTKLEAASAEASDKLTNARMKANAAASEAESRQQTAKTRQEEARQAEEKLAQAIDQRAERQQRAQAAEAKAVNATRASYGAQEKLSATADSESQAKQARAALTAETKALRTAEQELERSSGKVRVARDAVDSTEKKNQRTRNQLTQATNKHTNAQAAAKTATDNVAKAQEGLKTASDASADATERAGTTMAKLGSPQVIAAAGAVSMLAGSISMLAGDGLLGSISATIARMSGMVMAVSSLSMALTALKGQYVTLTAALAAYSTAMTAALGKTIAFLALTPAGWVVAGTALLTGLVYWLTRTSDAADKARAALAKQNEEAAGTMASQFRGSLEDSVNRWMTDKNQTHGGKSGLGFDDKQTLARLEEMKTKSEKLARHMARIREAIKPSWDAEWNLRWTVSAEAEFDEKAIQDSMAGPFEAFTGTGWTLSGKTKQTFNDILLELIDADAAGDAWSALLAKLEIPEDMAREMGLDLTKSWAANELALVEFLEVYDRMLATLRGEETVDPLERTRRQMQESLEITKAMEKAWEAVEKKREQAEKNAEKRQRGREVEAEIDADPYHAERIMAGRVQWSRSHEEYLRKEIAALKARNTLMKSAVTPDYEAIKQTESEITDMIRRLSESMDMTTVWEDFGDKAEDAVRRAARELDKLAEKMKSLDADFAQDRDDKRFEGLLKSDWVSAAKEVGQAMARNNKEWLRTGAQVARLMQQAQEGDMGAQRRLEAALKRREELYNERRDLEGRQKAVDSTWKDAERSYDNVQEAVLKEEQRTAKEEWDKYAMVDPMGASEALQAFIDAFEKELRGLAALAGQAASAGDFAALEAYEKQIKDLSEGLGNLRDLEGQKKERQEAVGGFSAAAMEAMLRGMDEKLIARKQLESLESANDWLHIIANKVQVPSVVAAN